MRRQEDIGRFQIAMDDAAAVQRAERGQDAESDRDRLRSTQRSITEFLFERLSLEQLHGNEEPAGILTDFIDLADVRVVDAGGSLGLTPQALARHLVAGRRRQGLQRDRSLEPIVARRVDDAHPAFTELALNRVAADVARQSLFVRRRPGRRVWHVKRRS